ncbi:uncharacterized protein LOC124121425 isoform X2 [Haliotis rufescens]|uniref:uncharacterized protein LOC124121425 isoform X2 n=1 Tax=Haliotis rufescens TaxID=6454 RepID=UPI00201F59C5|nr:uncharacterized protein LOC124121425 isoform X2 [Haliotis rufescens]
MQTESVPYQPGMTLGREYDLKTYSSGLDLFTDESMSKVEKIDRHRNIAHYSVIQKAQDVHDMLNVSGELSLKVKANLVMVGGTGSYLKECRTDDNTLEIIAVANVETGTETMKETKLKSGIKRKLKGTHFFRSITYGGELLVRIRIKNSNKKQLNDIHADLKGKLSFKGMVDAGAKAKFKQLENDLSSSSEINIDYFSTTPTSYMPRDVDGMLQVLDDFKREVMEQNDGKGCPCRCELVPLKTLSSNLPDMLKDKGLEVLLEQLEANFDDLLAAKAMLDSFLGDVDVELTESQEEEASAIEQRLVEVLRVYLKVVAELDLTKKKRRQSEPIEKAFKEYDSEKKVGGFRKEVSKFISKLKSPKESVTPVADLPDGEPLDIILMGKTNRGASTTGNTIFGEKKFSSQITTATILFQNLKISESVGGRKLNVMDLDGAVDQALAQDLMVMLRQSGIWFPHGVHVVLLILSATERLSKEEISAVESLRQADQDILRKHVICVFTRGDSFHRQMELDGKSLTFSQHIESASGPMRMLLQDCQNRYVLFNNAEADLGKKREMVIDLVKLIDSLMTENRGEKLSLDLENLSDDNDC